MQGYNFTERVRKALALAREEAVRLHHEYVGTEHVLLGIVREGGGVATAVLTNLGLNLDQVGARVEEKVKVGEATQVVGPDLPYSSRAKKTLELAMTEARELGHNYVGTEHLLLGVLREEKGVAAQVLVSFGVTTDRARTGVLEVLATADRDAPRIVDAVAGVTADRRPNYGATMVSSSKATRLLLSIAAIPAWVIGIMLVFNAKGFEAPMGIVVDAKTATIAQAQGAILIGLGFINWLARGVTDRTALWAVLYGNFVVQAISFAVVLRALVQGLIPMSGIAALVLHVLLGSAFAWQALRFRRS